MHSLEQRRGKKLPGCHKKVSCRSKAANPGKSWREKKGFTGKSAYKQTVLYHYRDRITACLQRDSLSQIIHDYMPSLLPLSSNTAQNQSWGTLVAALNSSHQFTTCSHPQSLSDTAKSWAIRSQSLRSRNSLHCHGRSFYPH